MRSSFGKAAGRNSWVGDCVLRTLVERRPVVATDLRRLSLLERPDERGDDTTNDSTADEDSRYWYAL